eukprot:1048853-Amphidinium_carterae.1
MTMQPRLLSKFELQYVFNGFERVLGGGGRRSSKTLTSRLEQKRLTQAGRLARKAAAVTAKARHPDSANDTMPDLTAKLGWGKDAA